MPDAHEALVDGEKVAAEEAIAAAQAEYGTARTTLIVLHVVGLGIAIALGYAVSRAIVRGLDRERTSVTALEAGDLTVAVGLTSKHEVGRMGAALDGALTRLRGVVATIGRHRGDERLDPRDRAQRERGRPRRGTGGGRGPGDLGDGQPAR